MTNLCSEIIAPNIDSPPIWAHVDNLIFDTGFKVNDEVWSMGQMKQRRTVLFDYMYTLANRVGTFDDFHTYLMHSPEYWKQLIRKGAKKRVGSIPHVPKKRKRSNFTKSTVRCFLCLAYLPEYKFFEHCIGHVKEHAHDDLTLDTVDFNLRYTKRNNITYIFDRYLSNSDFHDHALRYKLLWPALPGSSSGVYKCSMCNTHSESEFIYLNEHVYRHCIELGIKPITA